MNDKLDQLLRNSRPKLPSGPANEYQQIVRRVNEKENLFFRNLKKLILIPALALSLLLIYQWHNNQIEIVLTDEDFLVTSYEIDYDEWNEYSKVPEEL